MIKRVGMMYLAAEFFHEDPDVVAVPIVSHGTLIPVKEESYTSPLRRLLF